MNAPQRVVTALDELLFNPGRWFAIDTANQRVAGVVVPTLESGLRLVGSGPVASIVGRVRDEVLVVDVDVDGERGYAIAEQLTGWCVQQGLWSLVRPSGGAPGRAHVFIVPEDHEVQLRARVAELRATWRTTARAVDVRRDVRPLSAPHRHGGRPRPLGVLSRLGEQLRARLPSSSAIGTGAAEPCESSRSTAARARGAALRSGAGSGTALAPRPRRPAPLPAEWDAFLRAGISPEIPGQDQSRSAVEVIATGHLLRAGHTASSAWQLILQAHPRAMSKARANHRRWVAWVWNPAVRADLSWAAGAARRFPAGSDGDEAHRAASVVVTAVTAAREALCELQWRVSARRRPALLLVGHTVLDRMERTGSLRVPVPERDLVLDTGIADRKTIRSCLRLMGGPPGGVRPIGRLHTDSYDPQRRDTSSHEFEILPQASARPTPAGVRQIPPPGFHTPAPGTWAALSPLAHSCWRALTQHPGLGLPELAAAAGLPTQRGQPATPSQLRTTRSALERLADSGLAVCDELGRWVATGIASEDHARQSVARYTELAEQVASERAEFRSTRASQWSAVRAADLKRQRGKERAWWDARAPLERAQRRSSYAAAFAGLPATGQAQNKARWAARRVAAGEDESRRHDDWLDRQSMDQVIARSVQRAARFAGLPPPLQQAYAAAWRQHRETFGIARGTALATSRLEYVTALPDTTATRDTEFLQRQHANGRDHYQAATLFVS